MSVEPEPEALACSPAPSGGFERPVSTARLSKTRLLLDANQIPCGRFACPEPYDENVTPEALGSRSVSANLAPPSKRTPSPAESEALLTRPTLFHAVAGEVPAAESLPDGLT